MSSELERVRLERDFYLRLLSLGTADDLDSFLEDALELVVELAGAEQGYLELRGQDESAEETWHIARGFSETELADVRARISSAIMAEALSTGQTVVTPSASVDPRFRDSGSVRAGGIGAVVCAPIGSDDRLGVIYLHADVSAASFSDGDRERVEMFARHLGPFADRLIARRERDDSLDPTLAFRKRMDLEDMVGRSEALAKVLEQIDMVAPLDVNVLLTGPTGTGKSLAARVIHDNGRRRDGPFIELNCAAIQKDLLENELFGSLPGAFTDARKRTFGKVHAAQGGTLFLDEIGELPLESQAKLLQLLQTRQYYPLGASRAETADIRLISATNRPLEAEMAAGRFREDLYFRLQVLPVALPPLAERLDDIPALCEQLVDRACRTHGFERLRLLPDAVWAVRAADWPGNIRELAHALEAAVIRAVRSESTEISVVHIFPERGQETSRGPTWNQATREFQRGFLRESLERHDWDVRETARQLEIAKATAYGLIKTLGLKKPGS